MGGVKLSSFFSSPKHEKKKDETMPMQHQIPRQEITIAKRGSTHVPVPNIQIGKLAMPWPPPSQHQRHDRHLIYGVTELEMVTKNNNKIRRESEERTTAASSILTKLLKPRTTAAKLARAKLKQCQEKTATVMMQCDRSAVVYCLL
jgi:hypothetical protein